MLTTLFIILQVLLLLFMALHDWVSIPPFTDIAALKAHHSYKFRIITTLINTSLVLIPLAFTIIYQDNFPFSIAITISIIYGLLTIGTLCAWWIPYIFGSSAEHKAGFQEYEHTHRFLPKRGDNVVPNTLHVALHLLVWACFGISLYYLLLT